MNYINPASENIAGVTHKTFYSNIYSHDIGYNIYLPAEYDSDRQRLGAAQRAYGHRRIDTAHRQYIQDDRFP